MSIYSGPADWWTDGTDDGRRHVATKGIVQSGLVLNLDAGVSASYPGSGSTWNDLSGNQINGTLFNSPIFTNNYFTGFSSSYITTSNSYGPIPVGTTSRTIIAGFRTPSTMGGYQHIVHYGNQVQYQSFGLTIYSGYLSNHTWSSTSIRSDSTLAASTDYIGAVTFNNTSSPKNTFYLNGIRGTTGFSQGMSADYAINTGSSYHINIGTRIGPAEYFGADARVYFVLIYNRDLTSIEIEQIFNSVRGRYGL